MKILVKIQGSAEQRFLVEITDKAILQRIQGLINEGKRSKAIVAALLNSKSLKDVSDEDASHIEADLILAEKHIYLDLC